MNYPRLSQKLIFKIVVIIFILLFLANLILISRTPTPAGKLLFDGELKTGVPGWDYQCQAGVDRGDFTLLPSTRHPGTLMGKFRTNQYSAGCAAGFRMELTQTNTSLQEHKGDERWYSTSFMLDPTWPYIESDGPIITQWHGPTSSPPLISINTYGYNGKTALTYAMCTGDTSETCADRFFHRIITPDIELGVWYDLMVHVKWTATNTGFVEIYLKKSTETQYTQLVNNRNVPTLQNIQGFANKVYSKHIGLYGSETETLIIYHSGYKVGTTRADVEEQANS